jgi:hypothetical protein
MPYRRSLREYYSVFRRFIFARESTIFFKDDGRRHKDEKDTSSNKTINLEKIPNVLLEDVIEIPKKYTVPLKSSQKASQVQKTAFDSGER